MSCDPFVYENISICGYTLLSLLKKWALKMEPLYQVKATYSHFPIHLTLTFKNTFVVYNIVQAQHPEI